MKKFFLTTLYKKMINRIFNPFLSTNIKPMPLELKENEHCLVIAPHPDDESIGCGGVLNLYPEKFDVLCLTHGSNEDARYSEMSEAMSLAKIKNWKMLNLKDKKIIDGWVEFKNTNISNYDYIFIPYIFDQHKDHKAVSVLLSQLLANTKYKPNLKIAFYEVWSTINMPQYYVDISSVAEKKKEMINKHQSQVSSKSYADKILGLNSYRGLLKNLDYAECFAILDASDFKKTISKLVDNI